MPTIQADVTTRDLVRAVGQLSLPELDHFLAEVLDLRAQRVAPSLPSAEAGLLEQISRGVLPEDKHRRYHELRRKLEDETLAEEDHAELLSLSDEAEERNARRVEALLQLARLRHQSPDALMNDLGLAPCTDE